MIAAQALSGAIFGGLGMSPELMPAMTQFTRWTLIGVFPLLLYRVLASFLKAHANDYPLILVTALVLPSHYGLTSILTNGLGSFDGFGFLGVPLALSISWILLALFTAGYVVAAGLLRDISEGFSFTVFKPAALLELFNASKSIGGLEMVETFM